MRRAAPLVAVVDLETTGFAYNRNDRVIEVGVVLLDDNLAIEDRWETLVNPQRDIGATRVHRITAKEVLGAPEFRDVADELARLIEGRVLVAHNAAFDTGFLRAEFVRSGFADFDYSSSSLCTMRLAPRVFPAANRSLKACCDEAGIINARAHSALADAEATAELYAAIASSPAVKRELRNREPVRHVSHSCVQTNDRISLLPRTRIASTAPGGSWMSRIAEAMPRTLVEPAEESYLAVLDRALEDRLLTAGEAEELVSTAQALNLDRVTVRRLHSTYLAGLAALAWADGIVTRAELADLHRVATQLSLPPDLVRRLSATPPLEGAVMSMGIEGQEETTSVRVQLKRGDRVTFTGDMNIDRSEWERRAEEKGLDVGGVAKKSALLVAADPDSLSGKAKKARSYGVPIVGEDVFARLLGELS